MDKAEYLFYELEKEAAMGTIARGVLGVAKKVMRRGKAMAKLTKKKGVKNMAKAMAKDKRNQIAAAAAGGAAVGYGAGKAS